MFPTALQLCENEAMTTKVHRRTSNQADDSKVVRYVIDTRASAGFADSSDAGGKGLRQSTKEIVAPAKSTKSDGRKGAKPKGETFTVLTAIKPANPYIVSSPEKALEIAKRVGIFTATGKLSPVFSR